MYNDQVINRFYRAFQKRDFHSMNQCYHPKASFEDPAFGPLNYNEVRAMWHMLCEAGKDLKITFSEPQADEHGVSCKWEAKYTFSATGRKVHNRISASFQFEEDLIRVHKDEFNLAKWSGMALGFGGKVLGGTTLFKKSLRKKARKRLSHFIESHPEYQDRDSLKD